eukprot:GHVU01152151.1.p1 GENE.GHVU01152151.1~~GHVU01152151.1.p1  ORF type:complete len:131 (+),score=27.45 GHVU01152151.1:183-575(+)
MPSSAADLPTSPAATDKFEGREYLLRHGLEQLIRDLVASVGYIKPEDVRVFLGKELARRRHHQGFDVGMYREEELVNSFHLADLDQSGMITCEQCKEALRKLTTSERKRPYTDSLVIPQSVSLPKYISLA